MTKYIWNQGEFLNELHLLSGVECFKVAVAYLSFKGVEELVDICKRNFTTKEKSQLFLSVEFSENNPAEMLSVLQEYITVYMVPEPFMHSKVFEFNLDNNSIVLFNGSANMTKSGLLSNVEMVSKEILKTSPIENYWKSLEENGVPANKDIVELYKKVEPLPLTQSPRQKELKKVALAILNKCKEDKNRHEKLKDYYFTGDDYETLSSKWWDESNKISIERRKFIQDKLLSINTKLAPLLKSLDLYNHPHPQHITSGIIPSQFNHGRVSWICLRYGKHSSELNPFGNSGGARRRGDKIPMEQFHKHASMQLTVVGDGVEMGLFHSTAYDGVDRSHVKDHWESVKQNIRGCYDGIKGYGFIWHFYDGKQGKSKSVLKIDEANAGEFISFYNQNDQDGLESFCIRRFDPEDELLKEKETIVQEAKKTFQALKPLYDAMTFRIPVNMR